VEVVPPAVLPAIVDPPEAAVAVVAVPRAVFPASAPPSLLLVVPPKPAVPPGALVFPAELLTVFSWLLAVFPPESAPPFAMVEALVPPPDPPDGPGKGRDPSQATNKKGRKQQSKHLYIRLPCSSERYEFRRKSRHRGC
jgi:hypothetical protein